MAYSLNRTAIVGRVGSDPRYTVLQSGRQVMEVNVAYNKRWTDRNTNEQKEKTTWFTVKVWGNQADAAMQSGAIYKGATIYAEGEVEAEAYIKDGQAVGKLVLTADTFIWFNQGNQQPQPQMQQPYYPPQPQYDPMSFGQGVVPFPPAIPQQPMMQPQQFQQPQPQTQQPNHFVPPQQNVGQAAMSNGGFTGHAPMPAPQFNQQQRQPAQQQPPAQRQPVPMQQPAVPGDLGNGISLEDF